MSEKLRQAQMRDTIRRYRHEMNCVLCPSCVDKCRGVGGLFESDDVESEPCLACECDRLYGEARSLRTEVERLEENQGSLPDDYVMIPASEWQHMVDTEHKAEQLGARVARLEKAYDRIHPLAVSHAITHNRSRVVDLAEKIRNESPAQSLASIEARALERAADKLNSDHIPDYVMRALKGEAARLRAGAEK